MNRGSARRRHRRLRPPRWSVGGEGSGRLRRCKTCKSRYYEHVGHVCRYVERANFWRLSGLVAVRLPAATSAAVHRSPRGAVYRFMRDEVTGKWWAPKDGHYSRVQASVLHYVGPLSSKALLAIGPETLEAIVAAIAVGCMTGPSRGPMATREERRGMVFDMLGMKRPARAQLHSALRDLVASEEPL